jgi:glycerol 3-phosphatase-2
MTALTAPPHQRPTYIAPDLSGLLVPHAGVSAEGDGYRCAGWTARWDGDRVELSGDGDPYDGLRALAAAAWRDETPAAKEALTAALRRLGLA